IEDGMVRFGTPIRALCRHCKLESERLTEEGVKYVEQLLIDAGLHMEIALRKDRNGARLSIMCPKMFGTGSHEMVGTFQLNRERAKRFKRHWKKGDDTNLIEGKEGKQLSRYIRKHVDSLLGSVMFKMATASASHSTFASGSRVEAAFLSYLEGRRPGSDIANWESLRSVELPWVRRLSPAQIVELRHGAGA